MLIPEDLDPRAYRQVHGLSQEALAKRLAVSFYSVAVWERRRRAGRSAVELLRKRLPEITGELAAERLAEGRAELAAQLSQAAGE